jgi:ABC-type multidrug transport system fused ATPase/permease subunit
MSLVTDIWSVLTARQRRWVVGAQLLSLLMGLSTVAGVASIAPFFAVLGNPGLIQHTAQLRWLYSFGFSDTREFSIALGVAFMSLVLLANLINIAGSFVMIRLAMWIGTDLQSILFAEYLHRPYVFHARTHSSLLFNNLIHETTRSTQYLLQNAFALNTNVVTALLILASMMLLNPLLAAALLIALAGGYGLIYIAVRDRLLRAGEIESRYFIEQTKIVNESLGAIRNILLHRTQLFFRAGFERSSRAFARAAANTQLIGQSPRYVLESVAVVGLVTAALAAGTGGNGIGGSLGQLTFLGFAAYRLLPSLHQAFSALVKIRADRPGFSSIVPDLRLGRSRIDAAQVDPADADCDAEWGESPRSSIALEAVSFRYEPDRAPALSGVSLRIAARTLVGIVGINGSGKTTLVDLIAGLLVPNSGHLEVDGVAIDGANRPAWQSRIAYVPQDVFLMDATIAQNIAFGVPPEAVNRARLLSAARLAQLDPLLLDLPGGLEHRVGERGTRLSGGQRQRIGIARALYKEAAVLILDEATNALDGLTEREMYSTLAGLRGRYTIILITHRLSSVRVCDRIHVFEEGKLARSGTYESLARESDSFRRLGDVA